MKEKNKKFKVLKIFLIIVLVLIVISVITTIGIGNYFVNYAISRTGNGGDREVKNTESIEVESIDNEAEKIIEGNRQRERELAEKWTKKILKAKKLKLKQKIILL